jgi:uncharacterized surface anchored protein
MKVIYTLLLSFLSLQVLAQSSSVEGIIIDKSSESPIEFASVSIYKSADSTLLNGTITGIDGKFSLKALKSGTFYLKIQFLGYDTKIVSTINLTGKNLSLGRIYLNPPMFVIVNIPAVFLIEEKNESRAIPKQPSACCALDMASFFFFDNLY